MKPLNNIRNDLREIRYYYSKKDMFDRMRKIVASDVIDKAENYNTVIKSAPVLLYDLYMSLYVMNNTQQAVADDWDKSFCYIRSLHEKLLLYMQTHLAE